MRIAGFLLTLIIIGSPASAAQESTSNARSALNPDQIAGGLLGKPDNTDTAPEVALIRKRLELIKQVVPGLARVAVLWWQPDGDTTALQNAGKAASATGLSLQFLAAADLSQIETAFADISTGQVGAILVMPSRMLFLEREYVVQSVAKTGLPAVFDAREFVENGGLMSYGPNLTELEQYATLFASKTEDRSKTAQTDQPVKLELVVNVKTANKLGLSLTSEFLTVVDKIVK
jgi:ABC-type uncharacterized transport system substrate-binding protein